MSTASSLNGVESTLKAIGDNVQHYAGAITGDFAPSVVNGDAAHFSISLDGVSPQALAVTFAKINPFSQRLSIPRQHLDNRGGRSR